MSFLFLYFTIGVKYVLIQPVSVHIMTMIYAKTLKLEGFSLRILTYWH